MNLARFLNVHFQIVFYLLIEIANSISIPRIFFLNFQNVQIKKVSAKKKKTKFTFYKLI